jgi:hypothetical protein
MINCRSQNEKSYTFMIFQAKEAGISQTVANIVDIFMIMNELYVLFTTDCECGVEPSGFIKCWEVLKCLYNWWPL